MKLECHKDDLRWAINTAERMTGKNLSLPILANIMLGAKNGSAVVKATNLDIGVELILPARVAAEGEVMVSGAVLGSFLSNLSKEEQVTISQTQNSVRLAAGKTSSTVSTFPTDDFPSIPRLTDGSTITVPSRQFINAIKTVWYSASLSDIKPEIASVYVYQDGGELFAVATDSFRLAEKKIALSQKIEDPIKLIIPFKNAVELVRVFEVVDDQLKITFSSHQFTVETDSIFFSSRLVDGIYPDYRQIIPKQAATHSVVLKQDLHNALKVANIFSDKLNQITFQVEPQKSLLGLYARNNEVGESRTDLDATLEGEEIEVSYNVKYLLDCFQSISTDSLSLAWNGKQKPLTITPVGDPSFLYLVMPLNR